MSISSRSFVRLLSLFVLLYVVFSLAFYKIRMNPTYTCPEASQANLQPETSESHTGTSVSQPDNHSRPDTSDQSPATNTSQPGLDWS